jgi:cobalt/nickel transport protein
MYPYDAPMVFTRLTKSNDAGDFVYTLDEPGIWFVGATMEPEEGQPVRGVFIVPVIESFPAKSVSVTSVASTAEDAESPSDESASASAPGFIASVALAGILGALYTIMRKE